MWGLISQPFYLKWVVSRKIWHKCSAGSADGLLNPKQLALIWCFQFSRDKGPEFLVLFLFLGSQVVVKKSLNTFFFIQNEDWEKNDVVLVKQKNVICWLFMTTWEPEKKRTRKSRPRSFILGEKRWDRSPHIFVTYFLANT